MTAGRIVAELKAGWAIARQAHLMRRASGSNVVTWMILSLSLLIGVVGRIATGGLSRPLGIAAGMPLMMLALLWWSYLLAAVQRQNHAAGFALVPRIRQRSLLALFLGWLVLTCMAGTALGLAISAFNVAFSIVAVLLATSAAATVAPGPSMLVLAFLIAPFGLRTLFPSFGVGATLSDNDVEKLLLAVMLVCALMVMRQLGRPRAPGILAMKIRLPAPAFDRRSLQGDCERRDRQALFMHVLGPGANMKGWVMQAVLGVALLAAFAWHYGMPLPVLRVLVVWGAIALQYAAAGRLVTAVYARRKEQALTCLAPHAPARTSLNASLARGLVRRFGQGWLLITVSALLLHVLLGGAPASLLPLGAALCMPVLAGGILLRDFAHGESQQWRQTLIAGAWHMLTFGLVFFAISGRLGSAWALVIAGAFLGGGWLFTAFRKRAMLAAAPAFPAGRNAQASGRGAAP